jgi:L-asparaginase
VKKRVLFLSTGGTIAMEESAQGGVVQLPSKPRDLLHAVPELSELAEIRTKSIFHVDSADMTPGNWVHLAREVYAAFDANICDGIVVLHGTDTMAYGASMLAFLLGRLPAPVVFTGSQRPLAALRSDARNNVVSATLAATMAIPEVSVCFADKVLRGVRTTKVDAWGFEAFASPNQDPLIELGIDVKVSPEAFVPVPLAPLDLRLDEGVLFLRVFPGLSVDFVRRALEMDVHGLVLSTYGTGTLPSKDNSLLPALREAEARDIPVVIVSQCVRGFVDLQRYDAGALALAAGAIDAADMTAEAAIAKLMVALGRVEGLAQPRSASRAAHVRSVFAQSWLGERN